MTPPEPASPKGKRARIGEYSFPCLTRFLGNFYPAVVSATADIAIRSSLTGHLVFATLHTNDAASAATRLIDIGIEPFLVASSVCGVLAQRLVREVCPDCRRRTPPESLRPIERQLLSGAGLSEQTEFWEGEGCEKCRFTGFRHRTAVGEVMTVTAAIRQKIQAHEAAENIKEQARREGMTSLRETALQAAVEGRTTLAEVLRVTQEDL